MNHLNIYSISFFNIINNYSYKYTKYEQNIDHEQINYNSLTFVSIVGPSLYPISFFSFRRKFGSSGLMYDMLCFFRDIIPFFTWCLLQDYLRNVNLYLVNRISLRGNFTFIEAVRPMNTHAHALTHQLIVWRRIDKKFRKVIKKKR